MAWIYSSLCWLCSWSVSVCVRTHQSPLTFLVIAFNDGKILLALIQESTTVNVRLVTFLVFWGQWPGSKTLLCFEKATKTSDRYGWRCSWLDHLVLQYEHKKWPPWVSVAFYLQPLLVIIRQANTSIKKHERWKIWTGLFNYVEFHLQGQTGGSPKGE